MYRGLPRRPDYVTVVPNGEPTLDINLGRLARLIRGLVDSPIAVLTNASLAFRDDVRADLLEFSLISIKVDTVDEGVFRRINRPHPELRLDRILEGVLELSHSRSPRTRLISETMLVDGLNTSPSEYEAIARFLREARVDRAYIMAPVRPPAEAWVKPPGLPEVSRALGVFRRFLGGRAEAIAYFEGMGFHVSREGFVDEVLRITRVHPMRLEYVRKLAESLGLSPDAAVKEVLRRGRVLREYRGELFIAPG